MTMRFIRVLQLTCAQFSYVESSSILPEYRRYRSSAHSNVDGRANHPVILDRGGRRPGYAIVGCPVDLMNMGKLRISIVEFLNTAPLVWGFTDGPLAGKYELSFAVPSQCAEDLRAGRADVGIIPSIEYQRMDDVVGAAGDGDCVQEGSPQSAGHFQVPIEMAKSVALDTNSRSSVALARILSRRHWNIDPGIHGHARLMRMRCWQGRCGPGDRRSGAAPAPQGGCAGSESAWNGGCCCCGGDDDEQPVKGVETLFVYDIAQQWREMTGLPACWRSGWRAAAC